MLQHRFLSLVTSVMPVLILAGCSGNPVGTGTEHIPEYAKKKPDLYEARLLLLVCCDGQ